MDQTETVLFVRRVTYEQRPGRQQLDGEKKMQQLEHHEPQRLDVRLLFQIDVEMRHSHSARKEARQN